MVKNITMHTVATIGPIEFSANTESKIPIGVVYSLIAFYTGFNIKNIYKFSKDILPLLVLYSGYEINNIIREKSFKNFETTTAMNEKCCINKHNECFDINDECINKIMNFIQYKSICYDENSLRFVIALQQLEGRKTEAN